jgi:H/ACA ribonucleoprotein complex non-core subunit NAF1
MDDDFYDTTPVKPPPLPAKQEEPSPSSANGVAASSGISSLQLPGLDLLSNPLKQGASAEQTNVENEDLEDGELSDAEDLYNDTEPVAAPAAGEQPQGSDPASDAQSPAQAPNGVMQDNGEPLQYSPGRVLSNVAVAVKPQPEPLANPIDQGDASAKAEATNNVKPETDDAKTQFLQAAEANKGNTEAEWELDSQQSSSSSSSSSDGSGESSEEGEADSDDEGELLDPEEQVRRLMMEALDEPGATVSGAVRTQNEVAEQFEKPDITITDDTVITELGNVEAVVDNLVIIKANTSGDYQVLESGSALCLQNRTVIGKVVEEIGRVQEPRYSVGFSDPSEIETLGIAKDTKIFYVNEHSTFVFTEPLKTQKFTDASNLYDEEANDVEFSDDEKEAEFKKKQKEAKKAKAEANREPNFEPPTGPKYSTRNDVPPPPQPTQYQGGGLNYGSDDDEDLGMYKPLARPDHFEDIVGAGAPLEDRSHVRRGAMRGRGGGWPDRGGRGFRGRGGGNDRGCFNCGEVGHKKSECPHRQDGGRGNNQQNQQGRSSGPAAGSSNRGGGRQARSPDRGGRHAGPSERGGIPTGPSAERDGRQGGQPERGSRRQEKNRQRNRNKENRSAASMSPNRQRNERPPQHSPGRGNSQGRKRNRYESPPGPVSQAPTSTSTNAYAQNNTYNNSTSNAWSVPPSSTTAQPAQGYAPPPQPAIPAGSYVNPAFYGQPPPAAAPAPAAAPQAQQQQNLAQWAQWFQLAAAMSQPQAQAPAPSQHPYHQQQPQPQQQQQQHAQPPPDPRLYNTQQGNAPQAQHGTQSLQDILRTLGGGQQNR